MKVSFATHRLYEASRNRRDADRVLGELGIRYLRRLDTILAADCFEALQKIASLGLHPLKGDREGQWAIRLSGNFRLIVTAVEDTLTIHSVEDYHGE